MAPRLPESRKCPANCLPSPGRNWGVTVVTTSQVTGDKGNISGKTPFPGFSPDGSESGTAKGQVQLRPDCEFKGLKVGYRWQSPSTVPKGMAPVL